MANALHGNQQASDGIHGIVAWVYATESARLAATGFVPNDVYKMAFQLNNNSLWILQDDSPITWSELASGASQLLNKVEIDCRKTASGTLAVGTVVYATNYDTGLDLAKVEAAKADSSSTLPVVGVIHIQATDTVTGRLMVVGVLSGLDTSGLTAGSPVYISHTVAGAIVDSPPPGPNVVQPIGVCLNSHATLGHIGINILSYRAIDYTNDPEPLGVAAHGAKNEASPSDHVHLLPKLDDLNTPNDNTDLDATTGQHGLLKKLGGGTANYLRADGTWATPTGAAPSSTPPVNVTKASAAAGSASDVSRQDHKHDVNTAVAAAQVPGDSAIEGSAISLARSDHKHSLPAYGSGSGTFCQGNDSRLSDDRDPTAHNTSHQSGGSDAVKLDNLATPDDNTDLDATTGRHGLLKKLGGGTTNYLRADGTWAAPSPSAGPLVKLFQGVDVTGAMTITTSSQVIPFTYESIKDDYYTHSTTVNPGEVTILQTGWYRVVALLTVHTVSSSAGIRGNPQLHIEIDSGSGFVQQPDNMGGYIREDGTNNLACSISGIGLFNFTADDKIRITVKDSVGTPPDEETVPYSSRLVLEYIDRTGAASGVVNALNDIGNVNAPAPTNGQSLTFDNSTSKWVATTIAAIVNGTQFQEGSSDGESTTTSTSWQQKLRITTPSLPSGKYRIGWFYEWGKSGVTDCDVRVQVNDTTTMMNGFEEAVDGGSDQYFPRGGFGYYTGSGVLNIDLDYRQNGGGTARIRRVRLEIWRVS